jgi:hypothetical protein
MFFIITGKMLPLRRQKRESDRKKRQILFLMFLVVLGQKVLIKGFSNEKGVVRFMRRIIINDTLFSIHVKD